MTLNCIVVDDSAIHRLSVVRLIQNHSVLHLVTECKSALETKVALESHQIDLIFLEVDLPVINGFDLLDIIKNKPQIIFISQDIDSAFRAFEYNATDYLLKPFGRERFQKAIRKAVKQHRLSLGLHEDEGPHLFVKSNFKKRKVYINHIRWIEALGDYVRLVTVNKSLLVLSTLKSFESKLPKNKFLRIHKSFIVSLDKIDRFSTSHVEISQFEIPLSRNKKELLTQTLENH